MAKCTLRSSYNQHSKEASATYPLHSISPCFFLFTASKSKNVAVFFALRAAVASFTVPVTHLRNWRVLERWCSAHVNRALFSWISEQVIRVTV